MGAEREAVINNCTLFNLELGEVVRSIKSAGINSTNKSLSIPTHVNELGTLYRIGLTSTSGGGGTENILEYTLIGEGTQKINSGDTVTSVVFSTDVAPTLLITSTDYIMEVSRVI